MSGESILIAGGGVAALEACVALRALGGERAAVTLVTPSPAFSFRAQQVREPFGEGAPLALPLTDVLDGLDVALMPDTVAAVAPARRTVRTATGEVLPYDALLLAVGGIPFPAYAHGVTFDREDAPEAFDDLLDDVASGIVDDVAFVVPDDAGWTLPAYDLALLLRSWAARAGHDPRIRVVTAERTPLEAFGARASAAVAEVLERWSVGTVCGSDPVVVSDTALLAGGRWIAPDRIVALPRMAGPRLPGIPCDWAGFVEVDRHGAVPGCPRVHAAGDGAAHRRKQGGLAAQQADVAVRAILRDMGVAVGPPPEPPVLRGVLATPDGPLYLQSGLGYGAGGMTSTASMRPLWSPPGKVATRWLGPHLDGLVARRTAAFAA